MQKIGTWGPDQVFAGTRDKQAKHRDVLVKSGPVTTLPWVHCKSKTGRHN